MCVNWVLGRNRETKVITFQCNDIIDFGNKKSRCNGHLIFTGYCGLYDGFGRTVINNAYKCLRCKAINLKPTDYHLCKKRGIISRTQSIRDDAPGFEELCHFYSFNNGKIVDTPCPLIKEGYRNGKGDLNLGVTLPQWRCPHYVKLLQKSEIELVNPIDRKTSEGGRYLYSKNIKLVRK